MKILLAAFLYTGLMVARANTQEDKTSLRSLYPVKGHFIKYQQEWQMSLYNKKIDEFKNNPIGQGKIVFLGNSITEAGGDWNVRFGTSNIVNRGISGDITEGVLNRLDEIIHYKPIALFLLIGINDIFDANIPERQKITPSYVSNNIFSIVETIIDKSPDTKIFIQTILPINDKIYTKEKGWFPNHPVPLPDQISDINSLLKERSRSRPFILIDLHSAFTDDEGLLDERFTTDGVHLNSSGYDNWVKFIHKDVSSIKVRPF
jgi:lysophospholipase L1-like esterase|tara:strand:- start:4721 stop:5503 length:783 start_codon:yes stop_codon:yes gene_type:complete